ncbi:hypothetical protein [Nocardioides plantarum]|uniref:Transposase n=1 Tax=Nocardioides plantarum TaxID=29299 RepID=A0ABV5KEL2_9ACTN|nr:hypothetical protein [Nocardioides plantarum]
MYTRYSDRDVMRARDAIKASGIDSFLTDLVANAKVEHAAAFNKTGQTKEGTPARVTIEALLVAMWLAANNAKPMLLTEFSNILFHGLSPNMRRLLDVLDGQTPRSSIPGKHRQWNRSAAKVVGARFKQMTAVIDPSDEIVTRANQMWADMQYRGLTDDQVRQFQAHLDWVCGQLLHVAYMMLPASVRAQDDGSRCIDATPLKVPATGRTLDDPEASSMPHCSYYVREGDHSDYDTSPDFTTRNGRFRRNQAKRFWALDLHLLALAGVHPGDRQRIPGLITSMTADRAALDPAGNARRLLASEQQRGFAPGYLTGDGLYAKAEATTFQIPAREAGYKILLPITKGTSGVQGSHASGMVLVDGTYYCPAISDHLRTIIKDYRDKRIDHPTFVKRIQARKKFEMVTKQKADERGIGERLGCRAANHSLTVKCEHKPASLEERLTENADRTTGDFRPTMSLPIEAITNGQPPSVCQSQAITMKPTDGAKFRQAIPFGTDEHTDIYHRLRQSQEGMHGFAKDEAQEALGTPGRRRVRTLVAQQLFAAFLIAAANVRKIRSFLERAETDEHGLYVKRIKRKGRHARTGAPPGAAAPGNSPPEAADAA